MKPVRAWKDPAFRRGLSSAEQSEVGPHPAGVTELSESDLDETSGAPFTTVPCFIITITLGACPSMRGTCGLGTAGCC